MKLSFPFFQSAAETRRIDELTKAPPGASKLGPRESLALELREWALTHQAEVPLFGGFGFKTQDAFVAATGHSASDVAGAQALIRDGNDASRRLVDWALEKGKLGGPKHTELALSPREQQRAALDLDLSLADVARLARFVQDEGKVLAARPGFLSRVRTDERPVAQEPPPADWNKAATPLSGAPARVTGPLKLSGELPPMSTADQVALDLRAWMLGQGELGLGGFFPSAKLRAFAAEQGYDVFAQAQPAADQIRRRTDLAGKVLDWALTHGHTHGPKNSRITLDAVAEQQAAQALGARPADVARIVAHLDAHGAALEGHAGFLRLLSPAEQRTMP